MKPVYRAVVRFLADEGAHVAVEYAAVLALIILSLDLSVTSFGSYLSNPFWGASNALAAQNAQLAQQANAPQMSNGVGASNAQATGS